MYVDSGRRKGKGKTYTRHLLRRSYREDGKVKKQTVANISDCSEQEVEVIRAALRNEKEVLALAKGSELFSVRKGLSAGAVLCLRQIAQEVGILDALGSSRQGKLALWQVMARVIGRPSRLAAVRLAKRHAVCDVLGLEAFCEDHLYDNLDWVAQNQPRIEEKLYRWAHPDGAAELFLYDVTSSYLEGVCNDLAAFGYNRDGKKGKMQIVVGLMCDEEGRPVSTELFRGNTQDPQTFAPQLRKATGRFGARGICFVGDRGMIKGPQIQRLGSEGFSYITAITKSQIRSLMRDGVIQLGLFDEDTAEVQQEDGTRYVLRRNPVRAEQLQQVAEDKLRCLKDLAAEKTRYLQEHPRAEEAVARRKVSERAQKLRIDSWVKIESSGRRISVTEDEGARQEAQKLDGCYVLKTDLPAQRASKEQVHARYKDLTQVERAFRTCKGLEVEIRPWFVRNELRSRGNALVAMLSYMLVQELEQRWGELDLTVGEGIDELSGICCADIYIAGKPRWSQLLEPDGVSRQLIQSAGIEMPEYIPCSGVRVDTRKKLQERRKTG